MNKIEYPIFLSKIADGKDKLEGKSQENLAKVISKVIIEDGVEKKVIGLEGEWGSGKSNLIKIIDSNLGENYHTFIFDSWGSQEDLTRKSFLEQLISNLFDEKILLDKEKFKYLKNRLLSNTSTKYTQTFPQIKPFLLILSLAILLFTILSNFYSNVLKDRNIIEYINLGIWKPILFIYVVPLALFVWSFILSRKEYIKERKENKNREEIEQDSKWGTLSKMFYWFKGKEINSEQIENIIEDEPSVKQFREYFTKIEKEIKGYQKLILVFDNLDRLDKEKIKSLWSSIHTFFAEDTYSFDSWVIIPYDKSKLTKDFDNDYNGLINKTFSINFRIAPPVVTQWEAFLKDNLREAFGENLINEEEKEYLIKLFDLLSSAGTIKPRQIINYINNLVSMYKEWEDDIQNEDMFLRYISLFVLTKDEILDKPNEIILSRTYLGNAKALFNGDKYLDTCMSMITFGVKKELADEVLLDRQLRTALREGRTDLIKASIKHRAFEKYFIKANSTISIGLKYDGLVSVYQIVSEVFSPNMMKSFWETFGREIKNLDVFKEFNDNHKAILINTNENIGNDIIGRILRKLKENFKDEDVEIKYFSQLLIIEEFIYKENLSINLFSLIENVNFKPKPYLEFLKKVKGNFKKYKINYVKEELLSSFLKNDDNIDVDLVNNSLNELKIIKKELDIKEIIERLINKINTYSQENLEGFSKYLRILRGIGSIPLKLNLTSSLYTISFRRLDEHDIYFDITCIAISNLENNYHFHNSIEKLTENQVLDVSNKIETYITFNDLLKLTINNSNIKNLKKIIYTLTENNESLSVLDLNWILTNFDEVSSKVYENDEKKINLLIEKLNFNSNFNSKPNTISKSFYKYLNRQDLKLIKIVTKQSLNYFQNLTKDELYKSFKKTNIDFNIFSDLLKNNLINNFSDAFYSSYDDYMKNIAQEKDSIPSYEVWDIIIDILNKNKLESTFSSVRDIFINDRGELKEDDLLFFEKGLIKHGNLKKKPNIVTLKIIIPLIKLNENFEIFLDNHDFLSEIINLSETHKESAIGELQLKYDSNKYNDDKRMIEISKKLNFKNNIENKND